MKSWALMHLERHVATINADGSCAVYDSRFMPYNLHLDAAENGEQDMRGNKLNRFYHWCSTRPLTLDRKTAKDFLRSRGLPQAKTDAERAEIALACHGLCLTDCFWIRKLNEEVSYAWINPFDHPFPAECTDIVLRDRGMIVKNVGLVCGEDGTGVLSAQSAKPNLWLYREGSYWLLKSGAPEEVEAELAASQIARCFDAEQVLYEPEMYQGKRVSRSQLVTSKERSIVFAGDLGEYLRNAGKNLWELVYNLDEYGFHMMNIIDYLIGNTDRHLRNWGFWVSNADHKIGKLFPLMDFNRSFRSYDTLEGDRCFTMNGKMTQKTAAIMGIQKIGLNQIKALPENLPSLFSDLNMLRQARMDEMLQARLDVLRQAARR